MVDQLRAFIGGNVFNVFSIYSLGHAARRPSRIASIFSFKEQTEFSLGWLMGYFPYNPLPLINKYQN